MYRKYFSRHPSVYGFVTGPFLRDFERKVGNLKPRYLERAVVAVGLMTKKMCFRKRVFCRKEPIRWLRGQNQETVCLKLDERPSDSVPFWSRRNQRLRANTDESPLESRRERHSTDTTENNNG